MIALSFDRPEEFLCDPDLKDFVERHHLALDFDGSSFNPRYAFGSQRDKDRHYNTPRAWDIQRFLNPEVEQDPRSFFLPWCQKPYRKITIEDVKYVLSSHYQDSAYDPYGLEGDSHSVGPSVPLVLTGPARRPFSNCGQIVLKRQPGFNGFAMDLCLSIRPFLSLRK